MNLSFDVIPMGAVRQNRADAWRGRPIVEKYRNYKTELRLKANVAKYTIGEELNLTFVMPMPPSWSKRKQAEMDGMPHQQKPDIDNLAKGVMDALCEDDAYVHTLRATKEWGREGKIIVTVIS